jgi:hypothetical protein
MSTDDYLIHALESSHKRAAHLDTERRLFFTGALTVSITMIVLSLELLGFRIAFALLASAALMFVGLLLTLRLAAALELNIERTRQIAEHVKTLHSTPELEKWLGPVDDGPYLMWWKNERPLSQRHLYFTLYIMATLGFGIAGLVAYFN